MQWGAYLINHPVPEQFAKMQCICISWLCTEVHNWEHLKVVHVWSVQSNEVTLKLSVHCNALFLCSYVIFVWLYRYIVDAWKCNLNIVRLFPQICIKQSSQNMQNINIIALGWHFFCVHMFWCIFRINLDFLALLALQLLSWVLCRVEDTEAIQLHKPNFAVEAFNAMLWGTSIAHKVVCTMHTFLQLQCKVGFVQWMALRPV